jgi:cytochrome c peroxidase
VVIRVGLAAAAISLAPAGLGACRVPGTEAPLEAALVRPDPSSSPVGDVRESPATLAAGGLPLPAFDPRRGIQLGGEPRPASEAALRLEAGPTAEGLGGTRSSSPATLLPELPAGFPRPLVPEDNPLTAAGVELGRRLFHDPRLSGSGAISCSSCHRPELAYTDGRARAVGATGDEHPRSAMTLTNVAYGATYGWDDPGLTRLEDQALVPLLNEHPVEMGVAGREEEVLARLRRDGGYRALFAAAFPGSDDPLSLGHVVKALASFERTLISGDSPYDRWAYGAEADALTDEAREGARLFFSRRLSCFRCHSGFNLSGPVVFEGAGRVEPRFHNTGLHDVDGRGAYPEPNTGVHRITGEPNDMGRFRAPTLRNVALTAPYMHDGSLATLEEVVDFYARGGRGGPLQDPLVTGFEVSDEERAALVAFLEALTDEAFVARAKRLSGTPARSRRTTAESR